jgi:hypothetical protein
MGAWDTVDIFGGGGVTSPNGHLTVILSGT